MRKIILGILAIALLTGCGSRYVEVVQAPGIQANHSKYAPQQSEYNKYGVISYLNQGFGVQEREEEAYKKMYELCNGKYRIVDNINNREVSGYYSYGTYGKVLKRNTKVIKFECVK